MNTTTRFFRFSWSFLGLVLLLAGCREEEKAIQLPLEFALTWEGTTFAIGDQGLDDQGRPAQLERLECYLSAFALHDVDKGWLDLDTVIRVNFEDNRPVAVLEWTGTGDMLVDGFRMGLGVPEDRNVDVDPAQYADPNHPLGFKGSAGMHWGWAAGYIFSVFDGRLLTDPTTLFSYHAGNDKVYRTAEWSWAEPLVFEAGGSISPMVLSLDAYRCLHGQDDVIDPEVDPQSHTGNNLELARRWVNLYAEAWTLTP